jgi:hypothetical protein
VRRKLLVFSSAPPQAPRPKFQGGLGRGLGRGFGADVRADACDDVCASVCTSADTGVYLRLSAPKQSDERRDQNPYYYSVRAAIRPLLTSSGRGWRERRVVVPPRTGGLQYAARRRGQEPQHVTVALYLRDSASPDVRPARVVPTFGQVIWWQKEGARTPPDNVRPCKCAEPAPMSQSCGWPLCRICSPSLCL